jgi:hypothetical protein
MSFCNKKNRIEMSKRYRRCRMERACLLIHPPFIGGFQDTIGLKALIDQRGKSSRLIYRGVADQEQHPPMLPVSCKGEKSLVRYGLRNTKLFAACSIVKSTMQP